MYLPHWPIPSTLGGKTIDYETVFQRASQVLDKLGNPHYNLPPVIHIAGTNGKGSTASLIAKIFQCHGYKAHLYTSPHLHDCNERIILDGNKISNNELYQIMEQARIAAKNVDLTFMEGFTIGAFLAFSQNPADVLVVECGMGARIDITNIIEKKLACVITAISMDHQEYLGNTLNKIAFEKSFIIKKNTPLIISPQAQNVKNILKIIAQDQGALSYFYDEDYSVEKDPESGNFNFIWQNESLLTNLSRPNLAGDHQYYNCAAAIATCMAISNQFHFDFFNINNAIKNVKWPSRLEKINNNLNKILNNSQSEIWLDGAHNEGGALALSSWLRQQSPLKNFILCGFSRNKCQINFLNKFKDIGEIYAIRVEGEPYPENSETICQIASKHHLKITNGENLVTALNKISLNLNNQPCRIIICGSLHLARDVRIFDKNLMV